MEQLGLGRWERVAGILAFNLGIETMQLIVVAATIPSLVLMSRTRAYPFLRIGGALFAGIASVGWIAERLLGLRNPVDVVVNNIARHGVWIAAGLFLLSVVCWRYPAGLVYERKVIPRPNTRMKISDKPAATTIHA